MLSSERRCVDSNSKIGRGVSAWDDSHVPRHSFLKGDLAHGRYCRVMCLRSHGIVETFEELGLLGVGWVERELSPVSDQDNIDGGEFSHALAWLGQRGPRSTQ